MAIGKFTPMFTVSGVNAMIQNRLETFHAAIVMRLRFIGETFVKEAREQGTYTDRTGNLRSSIGYIILRDGEVIEDHVQGKTSEGQAKARALMSELATLNIRGYVLIVVAGMEYAAAVEARGYDVITISGFRAEKSLNKAIQQLQKKIRA